MLRAPQVAVEQRRPSICRNRRRERTTLESDMNRRRTGQKPGEASNVRHRVACFLARFAIVDGAGDPACVVEWHEAVQTAP